MSSSMSGAPLFVWRTLHRINMVVPADRSHTNTIVSTSTTCYIGPVRPLGVTCGSTYSGWVFIIVFVSHIVLAYYRPDQVFVSR